MAVEVRQVLAAEHAEAGRVTRAAFAALYPGPDRSEYLDSVEDVKARCMKVLGSSGDRVD